MIPKALEEIRQVTVWKRGSQRAPHKPLLLLLALARVQRGEGRFIPFSEAEARLRALLADFGPPRRTLHPNYPFWRLQKDGDFWEIAEREALQPHIGASGDVPLSVLRQLDARGGFSEPVHTYLRTHPDEVARLAADILEEHFEPSLHESILDAVGMPWVMQGLRRRPSAVEFREALLRLYEHRCAVCGFDGRIDRTDLALQAAHVKWRAYGGPDVPENGILMCPLHHIAFDRGAVGLSEERTILVSQHLHGGPRVREMLIRYAGRPLRQPLEPDRAPDPTFIRWHRKEVFREPPRVPPDRVNAPPTTPPPARASGPG